MTRILPLGAKAALATGDSNATTVGNATVVRVLSTAGAAVVVRTDSDDNVIGSFTTLNNSVDLVEKNRRIEKNVRDCESLAESYLEHILLFISSNNPDNHLFRNFIDSWFAYHKRLASSQ